MRSQKRQSNFELLRIVAMFLIVLHHSIVHGILVNPLWNFPFFKTNLVNLSILNLLIIGGKAGVDIFILITGYFMINSHISAHKLAKLWYSIFLYSGVGLLFAIWYRKMTISTLDIWQALFPITNAQYWFMTVYVFLFLTIPFLNIVWKTISSQAKVWVIIGLLLVESVLPLAFKNIYGYSEYAWFICVYLIGASLRQSGAMQRRHTLMGINVTFLSLLLYAVSIGIFEWIGYTQQSLFSARNAAYLSQDSSPFSLGIALGLLWYLAATSLGIIGW